MHSRADEIRKMVETQIRGRGVSDARVLTAMEDVPRDLFVPAGEAASAYLDRPLPIGEGQTISQPFVVALMCAALMLKGGERVLEIGAGSGYAAAVLSRIAGQVFAIERIEALAAMARRNLGRAGCRNVEVKCGDGTLGWSEKAPFDAILVSAGAPGVPEQLKLQLAPGGRLVLPVGGRSGGQVLMRVTRTAAGTFEAEELDPVTFVPLIGEEGWNGG